MESRVVHADLHTHSTASDGLLAPADLIAQAHQQGLSIVGLTDHDTTAGLQEATEAGGRFGVRVVPGIELSTDVERGQVHILGYGVEADHTELLTTLRRLRESRLTRAGRILERLAALDMPLSPDSIRPDDPGTSVGRPHIARALVDAGYVATVREAFDRYIGDGKPAYIVSERLMPEDAVGLIRKAGGLPVLAHPLSSPDFPDMLPGLIVAGLAGIETFYGEYLPEQRAELARIADAHGILATGGSDFHGAGFKEGRDLGSVTIPWEYLRAFLQALESASVRPTD